MKILCTGDLHLGRRSSRVPAHLDPRAHSCGACWTRVVDLAIRERVDVVAVSGDLVDRANRYYEAAGPLEMGVRRLAQAGVTTVVVAGNHDHDVLPWLVEGLGPEGVRLLGRGGRWERFTLVRGGDALHVDGWSFPDAHVRENPLDAYAPSSDGTPVLGLLHTDLDQPRSPYAPTSSAALRARPLTLWLLGHIHAPWLRDDAGGPAVLYPGSPQAMDPGETGAHGAWIAEIGAGGSLACRMVPLSTVRYDTVEVDVDGVADALALDQRVVDAVRGRLEEVASGGGALRHLSCRVTVTGRTPIHGMLEERLRAVCGDLELQRDEVTATVESVEVRVRPARDLAEIARGGDAPAELARLIRALGEGAPGPEHERLLRGAERAAAGVRGARPYQALAGSDEAPDVAAELERQAEILLDQLLRQKETTA